MFLADKLPQIHLLNIRLKYVPFLYIARTFEKHPSKNSYTKTMVFNEIWNIHKNHLLEFIKTKIDDASIADDILQEVGIKLHDNLLRKTAIKNYKNWLFQVTRNTVSDYYRKANKHNETALNELELLDDATGSCVCDLSGFVIQNYLPEKYGKPLYLSDIEQKSQQEIADLLALSLSATKTRIGRARKKLKELITDCVDVQHNDAGQITDFRLKNTCELPVELKNEMERMNLVL